MSELIVNHATYRIDRSREPEWFASIKSGDTLRTKRGRLRTVIDVTRRTDGALHGLVLRGIHGAAEVYYDRYALTVLGYKPNVAQG